MANAFLIWTRSILVSGEAVKSIHVTYASIVLTNSTVRHDVSSKLFVKRNQTSQNLNTSPRTGLITIKPEHSGGLITGKDLQRPKPVQSGVRKLVAVAAQATVAARIASRNFLHALLSSKKSIGEDFFAFKPRHQPGAARHVVIKYDCGLIRSLSTVIVTFRSVFGTPSVSAAPSRNA